MSEHESGTPRRMQTARLVRLVVAVAIFAVLIAIRTEFNQTWLRLLIVACAGAALGWGASPVHASQSVASRTVAVDLRDCESYFVLRRNSAARFAC